MKTSRSSRSQHRTDSGTSLILAIVFLLVMGLAILALANFAVGSSATTANLRSASITSANAQSAASVAIQQVRANFNYQAQPATPALNYNVSNPTTNDPAYCSPAWAESAYSFRVYCVGFQSKNASPTRTVDFYVCATSVSFQACTGCPQTNTQCTVSSTTPTVPNPVALFAEAQYNDVPPAAPGSTGCDTTTIATCGLTMSISAWDLRLADQ
jgi:Tfp pilus assembly protein PilX